MLRKFHQMLPNMKDVVYNIFFMFYWPWMYVQRNICMIVYNTGFTINFSINYLNDLKNYYLRLSLHFLNSLSQFLPVLAASIAILKAVSDVISIAQSEFDSPLIILST